MRLRWRLLLVLSGAMACAAQDVTPVIHVPNPPNTAAQQAKHYVILVSLDGFRFDYPRKFEASHLDDMAFDGASTPDGMFPSFPSTTFPNHYTLVTGLRPEHHGIVAMEFYDSERKETYKYNDDAEGSDGTWYQGTPIWSLAEQQGMRSACFFWPGSAAEIAGKRPSYYLKFDDKVDDAKRVEQIANWLKLPAAERPHLITLYYANVDYAGHTYGPDADQTRDAVKEVDKMIGKLRSAIKASKLPVDLIVTADHGMITAEPVPVVLDRFVNFDHFHTAGSLLYADSEAEADRIYTVLKTHPDPRFDIFRRSGVPKELDYDANPREGDPVIVPRGAFYVYIHPPTGKLNIGAHGFDPHGMPEMKSIFYAEGPDIKPGVVLPSFDNVDVFPFMVKLLGLESPAVDGVIGPLEGALKK